MKLTMVVLVGVVLGGPANAAVSVSARRAMKCAVTGAAFVVATLLTSLLVAAPDRSLQASSMRLGLT